MLSNGGFTLKIGQIQCTKGVIPIFMRNSNYKLSEAVGTRLLGGCIYYAEYGMRTHFFNQALIYILSQSMVSSAIPF